MTLTLEQRLSIESGLEQLYEAAPSNAVGDHDQIREYIDVGEYGLALDDLADFYLRANKPVTPDIRDMFDKLATKMEMRLGAEWPAVAEILATQ